MNFFILILILLFTSCDFKPSAEGVENQIHVVVSFEDFSKVKTIIDSIFLPEILTPEPESFFELKSSLFFVCFSILRLFISKPLKK